MTIVLMYLYSVSICSIQPTLICHLSLYLTANEGTCNHNAEMTVMWVRLFGWQRRNVWRGPVLL
jgi:hypothetical protein